MFRFRSVNILFCFAIAVAALQFSVERASAQVVQDEYNLASGYYARGQWELAGESFERVMRLFPNTEQAALSYFFHGEAAMQQGNFPTAYKSFQNFLSNMPRHEHAPRAMFRLGETAYRLKQYPQAIRLLELFVMEHPQHGLNEFALPYLGELRLRRKEPQLAQRAYETVLRAYPDSQLKNKCRLGLAKALQMQGSALLAARIYKSIVDENDQALSTEAKLQWGILSFGHKEYEIARQLLGEALATTSDDESRAEASYWLARTELEFENPERAVRLYNDVIGLSENEKLAAAIYFDGALAAIQVGETDMAEAWLHQLRKRWPDGQWADDALQLEIDLAQRNSRLDDAVSLIRQFHENHANSALRAKVMESEGRVYYQRGDFKKSVEVFKSLLLMEGGGSAGGLQRETWKYLESLGLIGLDQLAEAETVLTSVNLEGQSDKLRSLVEIARATTFSGLEKYARSISGYQNYLALEPNGSEALRARAELTVAHVHLKQWAQADEAFEGLKNNHAGQKIVLDTAKYLAETAFSEKQNSFAEKWYKFLAEPGHPKDLVARGLSGMAWIQIRSRNTEDALSTFERLLNEYPDSSFAAEAAMARAKYLDESQQYESAAEMYRLVIERFGDSKLREPAILRCAYSLQKVGGEENLLKAKELLTDYLQLPGNPPAMDEAVYQLGWLYHDLNLAPHGMEKFKLLVRDYPNSKYWPDAAFRLVQHYVKTKDYRAADPLVTKLLNPSTPVEILTRAIFVKGKLAAENNDWESVSKSMRSLVEKTDNKVLYAKGNYWLAEALYRQDKFDESGDLFQRLLEKIDDLDASLAPWIYLRSAQCFGHLNNWDQAKSLAVEGSTKFPSFKVAYEYDFIVGRALALNGKFDDAIDSFKKVVDSQAGGATETAAIAQWRIGEAYFHREEYEKAIRAYYRVDSLYGYERWRAAALMQAGKCQEHLGNWRHAAKLYHQLVESFPQSEFVNAATERLATANRQAKSEINNSKRKR